MQRAAAIRADAARLARWVQVLQHLSLLIKEGTLAIPHALLAAADAPQPPDKLLRDIAARMRSAPASTLADDFRACCPDWQERPLLDRMFTRLGHGSQMSRAQAVGQALEEMRLLADAARSKADKDVRLWQTLGLTGGICLTILLL